MKKQSSLVVCTPFTNENWKWFAPTFDQDKLNWHFFYHKPRGILEKYIRQPNLTMIRTCREAVLAVKEKQADLLFTHDPRVSFWCAFFAKQLDVKTEHIAYSFNFPELPRSIKRRFMTSAFTNINKFIVYSNFEKQLYHDYFGIPLDRIDVRLWSVGIPKFEPQEPLEIGDYICAIGGNARDYSTLMEAMEKLPDIKLVLIARPHNLKNLKIPSNVKVFINIPKPQAMNILKYSCFMVLPLRDSQVPCGHVTLVAAMHLGKGFIITNSIGVSDYVVNDYNAIACEASAPDDLVEAIQALWDAPDRYQQLGENGQQFARENCSEESARHYLHDLLLERKLISNNSY